MIMPKLIGILHMWTVEDIQSLQDNLSYYNPAYFIPYILSFAITFYWSFKLSEKLELKLY